MKGFFLIVVTSALFACNSGNDQTNNASDPSDRPRDVNEAVTDSTRIVNDSVIVPDTNNKGVDPTKNDTSKTKMD